jgi:hypothetical protein
MKKLILFAFVASIAFSCGNKKNEKTEKNTEDSTKTTEVKKEPSAKEKLVGDWHIESMNGKATPEKTKSEYLTFSADGTGYTPNKKEKLSWSVFEKEGKSFLITKSEGDDADTLEVKTLEENKAVLLESKKDGVNEFVLKRKQKD